jgi:hypothetical protein
MKVIEAGRMRARSEETHDEKILTLQSGDILVGALDTSSNLDLVLIAV